MGGFFGTALKTDCVTDLFYGVDYHSHLGTRRGGMAAYGQIQSVLQSLLQITPYPTQKILEDLDRAFIKQNLSPGGSADLLSATCFDYFLKRCGNPRFQTAAFGAWSGLVANFAERVGSTRRDRQGETAKKARDANNRRVF